MKAYSLDFRKAVVDYVMSGNSTEKTSKIFQVTPKTIYNWLNRYKETNSLKEKKRIGSKSSMNIDSFKTYVNNNSSATLAEIGKEFQMTSWGARYWIKKLGYTYKKNIYISRSK